MFLWVHTSITRLSKQTLSTKAITGAVKTELFHQVNTPAGWELYDLKKDPKEMKNVYGDPQYKDVVAKLKAEIKRQRELYNETDKNFPHLQAIIDAHWND